MNKFVRSYIATALWSSCNDDGRAFDSIDVKLSFDFIRQAFVDCNKFVEKVQEKFGSEKADSIVKRPGSDLTYVAPHDFWLTRNGHGAGFWDGDWIDYDPEDELTRISKDFNIRDLYLGDDGLLYMS